MAADPALSFPEDKPVTTGGGGARRAPVDSFTADIPAAGGVPEQQAQLGIDAADAQAREVATEQGNAGIAAAQTAEAGAGKLDAEAQKYRDELAAFEASQHDKMRAAADAYDAAVAEASSKKYENHWADQSTGTKVLAAISSFLGGFATGTPVSRAQEWIDKDHEQQKAQMERLWDVAKARGASAEHLSQLMEAGERSLAAGYAGRIEAVKREIDHQATTKGTEQAFVNADKLKSDLDAKVAANKLEEAKKLRIKAMSHTVKGLGLAGVKVKQLPDGSKWWKNPANAQWEPMLGQGGGARAAPPPMPAAPAPAPVQPPPMVQQ